MSRSELDVYINICIPDKDIKEKILKENPVPANVKESQVLYNYIKELLTENKRTLTSTHEKSLKEVQEKALHPVSMRVRGRGSTGNDRNF